MQTATAATPAPPAPAHSQIQPETSTLPSPVRSRNNSLISNSPPVNKTLKNDESFLTGFSPFTLSFFDSDSSELANLSNSLGANLSLTADSKSINATQSRINRASEILESSLRSSSLKPSGFTNEQESNTSDVKKLKLELLEARSRIKEVEVNYNTLQDASQQALNEFTKLKEDFARESNTQKKLELVIVSLLKKNGGILSRKEIDRSAQLRVELERTCKEMINYRDKIGVTLDENADKQKISAFYTSYQKSLQTQTKSLISERDLLKHETKSLRKIRDDIVHEMVLLNTKNDELTTINNDLSRRAIQQEEISVPILTRHTPPPLSPSQSTDSSNLSVVCRTRKPSDASSVVCNVSSRNSFIKDQTPKLFRIKKKKSTMFGLLGGSSSSVSLAKPIKPEPSLSSSSSKSTYGSSKPSIYSSNNLNNSSQSLHPVDSRSISKNKAFMDSTASLQITPSHHGGTSSHSFQPMSFLRPVKCGACGDKIWGRSEYRCDHCGFSSHSRCLSKVPQNCYSSTSSTLDLTSEFYGSTVNLSTISHSSPPSKKSVSDGSMFGFDLSERVLIENRDVPLIVNECIKAVEARGLEYEGIYRKSGGAAQMRAIQLAFDQGDKIDLCDEEEYNDFCAVTSVLKQYFRELPNPLFTFELYDTFINISAMNTDNKKLSAFTEALSQLPKAHLDTIVLLFRHLEKVQKLSDENRMTIKNLSMVFAPTLMRHSDPSRDFLDISYKNATIEYVLLHTSELFPL
ncbi:hypothetical protein INT47_003945 [Mucor saturninus]|uniref:RhoGAP-domain-containing protein n=1 Tax=Mucor saturninus TaxID=64648 RepID=A0A8H7V514_9FUNG|nr:hypothetical protein INT47_003945 [Mucor saturninus]